ncbi:MAG: class II aldolase/adducin family protein, partial [Actinobacteria bacterium]|nr:class II aldolase/adducin family protein [Actinomycetota bacterium]
EPSSEVKMHIDVYKNRSDVNAVVHAHPPFATGFAVAGLALDQCILPEIIISLGSIPLAEYGTPSTYEIPQNVRKYLKDHNVFLLENHGALSIGPDVYKAYYRMESLELFAKITLVAKLLGRVNILGEEEVKRMIELRKKWGLGDNYPGCRINGKVVKDGEELAEERPKVFETSGKSTTAFNLTKQDGGSITISVDELIKIITEVVKSILNRKVF